MFIWTQHSLPVFQKSICASMKDAFVLLTIITSVDYTIINTDYLM